MFYLRSSGCFCPQGMLEALRVTELRCLLSRMGRNKSGLKKDLMKRVTGLLQNECSHELLSAVGELHRLRQVSIDARRSSKPNPITPSPVETISMPERASPGKPVSTGQHMIHLPFYQTLDTILPPTPLGMIRIIMYRVLSNIYTF